MSRIVSPPIVLVNDAYIGRNSITITPTPFKDSTFSATPGVINLTPNTDFSWADELVWMIVVKAIVGSPTAGTLKAKFQTGALHYGNTLSTSSFPLSGGPPMDLTAAQKQAMIIGGEDWPSPLCAWDTTVSAAAPLPFMRVIKHFGAICNLQLDASDLAGGTTPAFRVSVSLVQKGG